MSKISSITCAAVLAAACFSASAAYAGNSMVCTDATKGEKYSVLKDGGKIRLKGPGWSVNLTVVGEISATSFNTKTSAKGISTMVLFAGEYPLVAYYRAGKAYRQDSCHHEEVRTIYRGPPQGNSVLDGIKVKCAGEWPGDYRMQKYCIDTQVEAFNALRNY